jgi:hypothetical protein
MTDQDDAYLRWRDIRDRHMSAATQGQECAHCRRSLDGLAAVNGSALCHPDAGMDCYRLVTVYAHPMPCSSCVGVWMTWQGPSRV